MSDNHTDGLELDYSEMRERAAARPLPHGIDPLSIAARCPEVVALVAAAKAVILSYHLDTDPETWVDRLAAALAPFEGKGKESAPPIGEDLDD